METYLPNIKLSTLKIIFKDMGIKYSLVENNKILVKTKNQTIFSKADKTANHFDFYTRIGANSKTGYWFTLIGKRGKDFKETNKDFKIFDALLNK